ncbi:MAG: RNA methyltransferase [Fibrobacter sp.]|nr:RNA methyltransferase [Fibrobacter sp.]
MEAFRVLLLWQDEGTFIKESGLSPFAMELALGVCRRHLYLLYFIKSLVKRMPSVEVSTILEMGLFQMFFMDVPDHAAVSTSVGLSKAANLHEGSARLVNAVLRAARRSGLPALPPQRIRRVSIENSVPEWLVRRWFDVYGGDRAEAMAKSTLERPAEWIRVNLQKISAPVLVQKLGMTGASILYDRYVLIPEGVKLKALLESDSFANGEFSLQNPSAYEVVKLLSLKPGLKVWDACAAPGGKSALMAEMEPSLDILASDVSEQRASMMSDLMGRLGLSNIRVQCIDVLACNGGVAGGTPAEGVADAVRGRSEGEASPFDRILLDVPCSNMGVIARRPESVYRLTPESVKELADLQFRLLESASAMLAKDGILVYATCSPDPEETTKVINRFVKEHPEFVKAGDAVLPGAVDARFDGFFAQALEYKK